MTSALQTLDETLVRRIKRDGSHFWIFKHPTIGDGYADVLLSNLELVDIYLAGTPIEKLIGQVTCGEVGIKNAVVVPEGLYPTVLSRLLPLTSFTDRWRMEIFLTTRCDRAFLTLYLKERPGLMKRIENPGLQLDAVGEVRLAIRLHELGILPEEVRERFVWKVIDYAVTGEDGYVLESGPLRGLLRPTEEESLLSRIRNELVPTIAEARRFWQSNFNGEDDPEQYMEKFADLLNGLAKEFPDDDEVIAVTDLQRGLMNDWIAEHQPETEEENQEYGELSDEDDRPASSTTHSPRSIFDDIDQ